MPVSRLLGCSWLALVALIVVACADPDLQVPGGAISGEVVIAPALRPLLPPPPGATGRSLEEVEPNTVSPIEFYDAGEVETDVQPTIITGSMDATDLRDRILLRATGTGKVSIALSFNYTEGDGNTNVFLASGTVLGDSNVLAQEGATAATPVNASAVVNAGETLLVQLRYLGDSSIKYNLTISALGGTVVSGVTVVAVRDDSSGIHPARLDDPVRNPRTPIGAAVVNAPAALEADGTWRGTYEALHLVEGAAPVAEGTRVILFAYADNDGTGASSPANFALAPVTSADFIGSALLTVDAPADRSELKDQNLIIDAKALDQDFDGVFDEDRNGDGAVDDNCPQKSNPGQEDSDGDGVGNICDDCPNVADPAQQNTDGEGRGDACNRDAASECPYFGMYPRASCPVDSDSDGIDDRTIRCAEGFVHCLPEEDTTFPFATAEDLDNCASAANTDQSDNDSDLRGDACDDDNDQDGVFDADGDNCPFNANPDQVDADGDAVGDVCDLCPDVPNADQADDDLDGEGNACDVDADGDEVDDATDNCRGAFNPGQVDSDGDTVGDACDVCPENAGANDDEDDDQDDDGIGDACEPAVCAGVVASRASCASDADCGLNNVCLDGGVCLYLINSDGLGAPDDCGDDDDGDGVPDDTDNCVGVPNPVAEGETRQFDVDGDGIGDACDSCPADADVSAADSDGDGVGDACDLCARVPTSAVTCEANEDCAAANAGDTCFAGRCASDADTDGDGAGDACEADDDGDGICDPCGAAPLPVCSDLVTADGCSGADNCVLVVNTAQGDLDSNGTGDICQDVDADGTADDTDDDDDDGRLDIVDNCPQVATPEGAQADNDNDGVGDACDVCPSASDEDQADADGDGVGDLCDSCIDNPNPRVAGTQADADSDGLGDGCDADADNDGIANRDDNCVLVVNQDQADGDDDLVGNLCDICPTDADANQADLDGDAQGDACDADDDGDGDLDTADNCPLVANADQADADDNGVGDACERGFTPTIDEVEGGVDAPAQALGYLPVNTPINVLGNVSAITDDVDAYEVRAAVSGTLVIALAWADQANDYDAVIAFNGAEKYDAAQSGFPEVGFQALQPGASAVVSVSGYAGMPGDYTLTVQFIADVEALLTTPAPTAPIRISDFPDDAPITFTIAGTVNGAGSGDIFGDYDGDMVANDESDVYALVAQNDGTLSMSLAFDGAEDLDMYVWGEPPTAEGTPLSVVGAGAASPEAAAVEVTAGQTVYVSVHKYGALVDGTYTLTANLE
jgi:hypothetical protein